MRIIQISLSIFFTIFFISCNDVKYYDDPICAKYETLSFEKLRSSFKVDTPRKITNNKKIYVYGDYLLINELYKGIHVIDNTDKSNPNNIAFLKIHGNVDMAIKDNYLYVDSFMDIVVINLNDLNGIAQIQRIENVLAYSMYENVELPNGMSIFDFEQECSFDMHEKVLVRK